VRATATDDLAHRWAAQADFITDSTGSIDLASVAPIAGSYNVADANGLLWSMTLDPAIVERTPFVKTNAGPVTVNLRSKSTDKSSTARILTRRFLAPGIVQKQITDGGLVATMSIIQTRAPRRHPARRQRWRTIDRAPCTAREPRIRRDVARLLCNAGLRAT